jgi:hypothetical protein
MLKDTFDEMQQRKDCSSLVKSSAKARPIFPSPISNNHYQSQYIKPQEGAGNPAWERLKPEYRNTAGVMAYYNCPAEKTLLKGFTSLLIDKQASLSTLMQSWTFLPLLLVCFLTQSSQSELSILVLNLQDLILRSLKV